MNTQNERINKMLAEAFNALPDSKKERLIGYAEGVADMAAKQAAETGSNVKGDDAQG